MSQSHEGFRGSIAELLGYERIPGGGLRASFELECVKENPGEGERK